MTKKSTARTAARPTQSKARDLAPKLSKAVKGGLLLSASEEKMKRR